MDPKDSLRRRPLPTPGAQAAPAQRPNTPVFDSIPTSNFYGTGSSNPPPPLPSRPKATGSSHTTYIQQSAPPSYTSALDSEFREPESLPEQDSIPDLIPSDAAQGWSDHNWGPSEWDYQPTDNWGTGTFDPLEMMDTATRDVGVPIDGRSNTEENQWWNPIEREHYERPGPGMLPPGLAEALHNSDHSLFSVSASLPTTAVSASKSKPELTPSSSPGSPPLVSPQPSTSSSASACPPPNEDDVRTAIPHPNAYYCPKDHGWIILSWKSSTVDPPFAKSFANTPHMPFPDQLRRKRTASCLDDDNPRSRSNKTHHFHKYEKAIDAHKLIPPLRRDEWEVMESVKLKRRGGTIIVDNEDLEKIRIRDADPPEEEMEEGKLLDLYVCCQCSFYCVASGVIPGVIQRKYFEEFVKEKREQPQPGKTGEQSVSVGLETIATAIENRLWKGETRSIRINRPNFQTKIGWNVTVKRIFELLGFIEDEQDGDLGIKPPLADLSPLGRTNRKKLLRAWVEIGAWLADFRRIYSTQFKDPKTYKLLSIKIDPAREMYQTAIGAHPDQIPRDPGTTASAVLVRCQDALKEFGLTNSTYSAELLVFAYFAQCRCDPAGTVKYFSFLSNIVQTLREFADCPALLLDTLAMESSRDRFTLEDIHRATEILGFGAEGVLKVEYDNEIGDSWIENAWRECLKRSWKDPLRGHEIQRDANQAFRILAEARGSAKLRRVWEFNKDKFMTPSRAYDTLEVPHDVDDSMLITIYQMRLDETPTQMDRMREALSVIAESRDSERLKRFLQSGEDPGDVVPPTRPDFPRGLNQLGNTCYLNSLLQYFYTIKELREAVMPMTRLDLKALDDDKLTDDELKRHRVGGRLVTRREINRSKKFVGQLAVLFTNLEYCDAPSVTPSMELAELALVTSKDEDEEADGRGTESSNDTDATLVDELPGHSAQQSNPTQSSILGKRPRDLQRPEEMDVDLLSPRNPNEQGRALSPILLDLDQGPVAGPSNRPEASTSGSRLDFEGDVEMKKQPPLPARKNTRVNSESTMIGKQHDVAECMDNCMFQIETALLPFNSTESQEDVGKSSVVKKLFYGKIKQRLTGAEPRSRSSVHEKEDLFSHLPVNVADDGIDIYDGLSNYFDDTVEFEGRKHRMEVSLVELPPLLQIQLQRAQFNRDTLQSYKSQAYVKFGETIYVDRFMDNADPQKKARSKTIQVDLNTARDRLRALLEGKDGSYATAIEKTREFLSQIGGLEDEGVDEDLSHQLESEALMIDEEITQLRVRIDVLKESLESIWEDSTDVAYELTSVFIHRGSSSSFGHYFFYSRNLPSEPDSWFKYNDSDVSIVSKEEILANTTGSTANPYLLVFARKGLDVVDTVKRFDPAKLLDSTS
ncbi:cysteine proteinase [Pluteus cervinus]|uniref:Cysteine proteinase n=1 Tax=Pluteus cervinus TaxID=181527 RepID=A0ACD3ARD0_9AGAR|nr:cysteine proteinase [Pluteus cervinus]